VKYISRFLSLPSACGYLPDQLWRLEFVQVATMEADEYAERMLRGWRRFGHTLFRPRCPHCTACRSLRVDAVRFDPDRSQRRARRANEGTVALRIGEPTVTAETLGLFARFHDHRTLTRGWPWRDEDADSFRASFVENPFPTEQWRYELDGDLIGLGFVDALPVGLSAIYFAHDPALGRRSLGTWNVLCLIDEARRRGLPHVYLGYHVAGCPSLAYKARFRPHQVLDQDGCWRDAVEGRSCCLDSP
jgi:arginine-tRNA-protein transferase